MKKLLALLLFLAGCSPALAGVPCSVPFNLQNGQPADATQVMANYNALITCLGNAAAAGSNTDITSISGLTTPLAPAQGGTAVFMGSTSTGTNAQVVATTTPSNFLLVAPYQVLFIAGGTNTGAATLQVAGSTAVAVRKQTVLGLQPLTGGEILAGQIYAASYDGTFWQLLNPSSASAVVPPTSVTSARTINVNDCSNTLSLGGAVFYAVTFPAPGGFANGCTVRLIDADSGRGKGIVVSGLAASPIRLFPLQALTVTQTNGAWTVDPQSQLWANPLTFHVNFVSGNDNPAVSDCLAIGAGACKTFQQAVNIAQLLTFPTVGGNTIQADCEGNYTQTALGPSNSIQIYRGMGGIINIVGNAGSPLSCTIIPTIATTIIDVQDVQQATVTGFEFGYTSGGSGTVISGRQLVILDVNNSYFANNTSNGLTSGGGVQVAATDLASVNLTTNTLNGVANQFVNSSSGSSVQVNGLTIPGAGQATFAFWYVASFTGQILGTPAYGVSGTVAGAKYSCNFNAVISLNTAYPAALTAGTATLGCQANPP